MKRNVLAKLTGLLLAVLLIIGTACVGVPVSRSYAEDGQEAFEDPAGPGTEDDGDPADDGTSEDDGEPADDGTSEDDGEPAEGGTSEDDGEPSDDGTSEDDGDPADGGTEDGGEPADGGTSDNGGEPADDGTSEDDGEPADDGTSEDDGEPADGGTEDGEDDGETEDDGNGGIPAGQTEPLSRIAGGSRYETSIEAAERLKVELGVEKFENIIIASGKDYADALSGSYLAYVKRAPIILVNDAFISTAAEYALANLAEGGTVYILGGSGAVPKTMERALPDVAKKRLYGSNRYITNVKVLREAGVTNEDILVCSGRGFADSLSASAARRPILLVGTTLAPKQREFLHDLVDAGYTNDFYIIGGRGAISLAVEDQCKSFGGVTRIQGSNRYKTSVAVAEKFYGGEVSTVVLACGTDFPDGLTGGPIASAIGAPMLLIKDSYIADAKAYASKKGVEYAVVMGGPALISDDNAMGVLQ